MILAIQKNSVPTSQDKNRASAATSGNGSTTALTITSTPSLDGYVQVMLNGLQQVLGDSIKTKDCYFSSDGGTTAKAIAAITAGDTLYWNGVVAGLDLAASDYFDFNYSV